MKHTGHKKNSAGFTLTELMVSIGIMIFVLALILVNYRKFDSGIVLTNLAYDIGLSVRKAQTYGINVRGKNDNYTYAYGIHFDTTDQAGKKSYIIFADLNPNGPNGTIGNGMYDGVEEKVEGFRLQGNYAISSLCTLNASTEVCDVTTMDIMFKRPNPDARTYVTRNGLTSYTAEAAVIQINTSQDPEAIKKVYVYSTGQISIK